ncbi:MAG: chemotaxis protein CheW [Cyanobacteria bacterium P01_A01_bin.135]
MVVPSSHPLDRQKFITFSLAEYRVALPMASVLRILHHRPEGSNDTLSRMGLVQIGSHVIRAFDLHRQLNPVNPPPFLLIVRSPESEPFGLWVDGLPDIVEFLPDELRSLPPSVSRTSPFLALMSHTALLPDDQDPIFFLEISRILGTLGRTISSVSSAGDSARHQLQ